MPKRNAMNEILREEYIADSMSAIRRWNKTIADQGVDFTLTLPSKRFHRHQGEYAGHYFDYEGNLTDAAGHAASVEKHLPNQADRDLVKSLMVQVTEPGKMAGWIAAPKKGINGQELDYEYVKL